MKKIIYSILLVLYLSTMASAQDESDDRLEKARSEYAKQIERFNNAVESHLEKKVAAIRKQGNLEHVKAAKLAMEKFEETGAVPEAIPASVARILTKCKARLEAAYKKEIKAMVRAGEDDTAKLYTEELKRLLKEPRILELSTNQLIKITAKKQTGYEVGPIRQGEKLILQYRSGRWKGWGRLATESPDAVKTQKKDRCRVAIGAVDEKGTYNRLAVVPANTATKPYEWTAQESHQKLILRINDSDGRFDNNPDKGVEYQLQIYRY